MSEEEIREWFRERCFTVEVHAPDTLEDELSGIWIAIARNYMDGTTYRGGGETAVRALRGAQGWAEAVEKGWKMIPM